jgi:hypothetical protein
MHNRDSRLTRRKSRTIPIGYKIYAEDNNFLLPVPNELEALRQVRVFIQDGYTWRACVAWFVEVTGRQVSLEGLRIAVKKIGDEKPNGKFNDRPLPAETIQKDKIQPELSLDKPKRNYHRSRIQLAKLAIKRKLKEEQTELEKAQTKLDNVKKRVTNKKKQAAEIEKVIDGKKAIIEAPLIVDTLPTVQRELLEDREIIFEPNPGPQTEFLASTEKEVFYGGARGGGKSFSLLVDPLRYCDKPTHRALILRRTMPELRDMIHHTHRLYTRAFPGAKWREQEKEWKFPSGARIEFGYAETEVDALRYQGQSYSWIGVDELPQYPSPKIWNDLRGSLRSVNPNVPEFMRATGNPGNVGSDWVREYFIEPAPYNTRFQVPIEMPNGETKYISRRFIPAKLSDNPYLTRTDSYQIMLASLPEIQRRQWLEGDWYAWDGAAFPEFRPEIHVCEPFLIPKTWIRFRAADWGYSTNFAVLWFAVDYENNLIIYREFVNKGLTADIFARRVLEIEKEDHIRYGVIDSSINAKRGELGPSVYEEMRKNGLRWRMADRSPQSRKHGKMEIHRRLRVDEILNKPKLTIFKTCRNLIKDLPTLPLDEDDPEDVDTDAPNDHTYDALRYGCMSRPLNPAKYDWSRSMAEADVYRPSDPVFGY